MDLLGFTLVAVMVLALLWLLADGLQRRRVAHRLAELRAQWGAARDRDRNFEALAEFHRRCPPGHGHTPADFLDDTSWRDLNLDEVFARLDRTHSTPGEYVLYQILRCAGTAPSDRERRRRRISAFQDDPLLREAVQRALLWVGRRWDPDLAQLLWTEVPEDSVSPNVYRLLTAAALAALAAAVATRSLGAFLVLILFFAINSMVHFGQVKRLEGRLRGLRDLGRLLSAARQLADGKHPALADLAPEFSRTVAATRSLARKIALLPPSSFSLSGDLANIILDYINIFTLHQVRIFNASISELQHHQAALQELFLAMGELDACQSIASFRAGVATYAEPEIAEDGPTLEIVDARHPLLDAPVPNSLAMATPGIAVTGSNMSGKTTFLRTLALNVLLAQTVATCIAASYRGRTLRIACSMNAGDDLLAGKSYYLAEAERLLKIVRQCEGPDLVLALIDEPLAGTNSPERHAASREILRYLAAHRGRVVLSTHDVALVAQLEHDGEFQAYHFTDSADAQGIHFDYRLRPGLNYHANAIAVLRYLGFPEPILAHAMPDS